MLSLPLQVWQSNSRSKDARPVIVDCFFHCPFCSLFELNINVGVERFRDSTLLYEIITHQSDGPVCEPHNGGSGIGVGGLTHQIPSRSRHFYARQAQGLKIHFALPPIHPEEQYLRTNRRQQLIHTAWTRL